MWCPGKPRGANKGFFHDRMGVGEVRKGVPKKVAFELALKPEEVER